MKFANLCDHGSTSINLGDYLQFIVIDEIYKRMGISDSEIYHLRSSEIANYKGEKLLLPLNFITTIFSHDNVIHFSPDIIPVFLGLSLSNMKEKLDVEKFFSIKENREFFLKYSPVGCRDEYTYQIFEKYNIPAYLNGCLTATISRREKEPVHGKIFFADVPENLQQYIPGYLFDNCEFVSQQAQFSTEELLDYKQIFKYVKERYKKYKEEASFVITSRLHVAVPCTAMGIPVVFAKDYIDARFSWLEKLLPLYSMDEYKKIDWNPVAPYYEEQKEQIIELAMARIKYTYKLHSLSAKVGEFYFQRNKKTFYYDSHEITHKNTNYLEQYLIKNWKKDEHIKYGLWGITDNALFWINWIHERYPNAKFSKAIDMYKTGELEGVMIEHPKTLEKEEKCCIIVVAISAVTDAKKIFCELGWKEDQYCIAVDSFITKKPVEKE